ncbi:hypothetical protein EVU96_24890 [Bacillus infantis]|uniref:Gp138 family membrane-puncturing spike protein n=1 Tax=Bacillus infantis TaxID=324767 RepID=UPI00101E1EC4|nr:Gp138 family membrane-puncturing spike protein [Bacillus infantis]RYI25205.1 hypothetical protein EVU96_24890 [Bacillus infantis]
MSEIHRYFERKQDDLLKGMHVCSLCRIEKVDLSLMKADVVPLFEEDLPIIKNVPIAAQQTDDFIIRVPYKKGDIVLAVFSQRDIDSIMYGGGESSVRMMAIDDAIIVGGINLFTKPLPIENSEDLVISKKDFSTKLVLTKSGDILFQAANKLVIDAPGGVDIKGGDIRMTGGAITANGEDLNTDLV